MPTYDYECPRCRLVLELQHPMSDSSPRYCQDCESVLVKRIQAAPVHFKGAGFYRTDK